MDFEKILAAVRLAGATTPAFMALFDQVVTVLSPAQQAELKDAYARARAESDDAQDDFTAAGRGR